MSYIGNLSTRRGKIGKVGEDFAVRYLVSKGHIVLDRNFWIAHGEVDIVSIKDKCLYIIEVKTVVSDRILPEEHVDAKKRRKLVGLANLLYNDLLKLSYIDENFDVSIGFLGVILNSRLLPTNIKFEENLEI